MLCRNWLPLLVGLGMLFGCENDDDQKSGEFLRFSVQEEFIQPSENYWIIVSDVAGNVLDSKELRNASTYAFQFPVNLVKETVTLTLVHNVNYGSSGSNTDVTSYTSVPSGEYHFPKYKDAGGNYSKIYVTVPGFHKEDDPFDWFLPDSWNLKITDAEGAEPALKIEGRYFGEKTGLLAVTKAQPFQYAYMLLNPDQHDTLNSEDFRACIPRTTHLVGGYLSQLNVTGMNAYGNYYSYYAIRNNGDVTQTTWEIPTMPDIFDSYRIQMTRNAPEGLYETDLTYTEWPTELPILDASIANFRVDDNVIAWSTASEHTLDDVTIKGSTSINGNDRVSWSVKSAGGEQHIVLPRIPDTVLTSGVASGAKKTFGGLFQGPGMIAEIRDLAHYTGYQESVIALDLKATEWITPEGLKKMLQLQP